MTTTTQEKKNENAQSPATVVETDTKDTGNAEGVVEVVAAVDAVSAVAIEGVTGGARSVESAENTARRARGARAPRARRARTGRGERPRSEFDQTTVEVRRVARVVAGGRRFSFSVTIVIGDHKGRVGVGVGKGTDTALAIEKATRDARRHLIRISLTESNSILHEVSARYTSSYITIAPSPGRGIVAGSAMRTVLELSGVTDVVGKILSRSKNKLTIARATVQALSMVKKGRNKTEHTSESEKSSHEVPSMVQ